MENQEVVLETLKKASDPLKAGEIAEMTGIDKKDVSKAIKKLVDDGSAFSPKYCYYDAK
jgi:DNA-binding MarR family transcriptional regulator